VLSRLPVLIAAAALSMSAALSLPAEVARTWQPVSAVESLLGSTNRLWNGDSLCVSNSQHTLRFFAGRRRCEIDGTAVWLHAPFEGTGGSNDFRIAAADVSGTIQAILSPTGAPTAHRTIVLDPGHGGEDSGARCLAPEISERTFTFDLALRVSNLLARADLPVVLTRAADQFVALEDRTRMASNAHAAVFVSLHANFAANATASGVETYAMPFAGWPGTADESRTDPSCEGNLSDTENARLGFAIHSRLAPLGLTDRGFKRARYAVLRHAPCPAVLVECGFLSHTNDTRLLSDPAYRDLLATAIADGIIAYNATRGDK
jgi:N-acetylmuramoyl-L-alanine amidase